MIIGIILIIAVLAFVIGWFLPKFKANAEFQDDIKTIYICKKCGTPTTCKDAGCTICSCNDYLETGLKPSYVKAQRACGRWSEVLKQHFYDSQVIEMTQLAHQLELEKKQITKSITTESVAKVQNKKKVVNFISGIVTVALVFAIIIGVSGGFENDERDAWVCAQNVVESRLKSPSTADFCSYPEATVTDLGSNRYKITGYVDAQNSFGAVVRSYFTVTLTLTKNGYTDAKCSID